jgi:nitronate monooxygenase
VRALSNAFLDAWHGNETELSAALPGALAAFQKATEAEDFDTAAIIIGEAVGLIGQVRPAADVVADMVTDAALILNQVRAPSSIQR